MEVQGKHVRLGKMIIKLSLGIRILVLQHRESKGIICCFGEEQTLAGKKYEKKDSVRC